MSIMGEINTRHRQVVRRWRVCLRRQEWARLPRLFVFVWGVFFVGLALADDQKNTDNGTGEDSYGLPAMRASKNSASLLVGSVGEEFTIGFDLNSKYGHFEKLPDVYWAFRYRGNLGVLRASYRGTGQFIQDVTVKTYAYHFHRIGLLFANAPTKLYRLYGEGAFVAALPNHNFSDYYALGAYFGAGIELYANFLSNSAYYLEGGYFVTDALAEKSEDKVVYLNGYSTIVGWRYFF